MVAKKYIDKSIPYLKQTDSIAFAIEMMEEYGLNQLPVVENQEYKGLIYKSVLESIPLLQDQSLVEIEPLHPSILVSENFHLYEIARLASDLKLEILPVFSEENTFKGMINMREVAQDFISKFATQPIGAVFVLEIKAIDYSLTEISRLVESNEAKIMSMFTESDAFDPNLLIVTIKVNTIDLTRILATFERFEFKILAKFHDYQTQKFESSRIDLLLKYLEI